MDDPNQLEDDEVPEPPIEVVEQEVAASGDGGATVTPLADRRRRLTRPA